MDLVISLPFSGGISVTHIEDSRRMQRLEPSDPT
jgi:hypothetical protein